MLLFWLCCKIKFRLVKQCSTGGMFSLTGGGRPRNPPQVLKPPPCHHPPKCPHEASPTHHQVHQPNHNQPTTTNLPAHYKPINPVISQVLDWRSQKSMKWKSQVPQPTFFQVRRGPCLEINWDQLKTIINDWKCGSVRSVPIPHICQFWYTTTLFRSVQSTPKSV